MTNKWIKRIKNAQDNFFDKPVISNNYEEISDFDREFIRAKNITSFAGELCKLAGGLGMFFGIIFTFYALASGSLIAGISGIGISFGLAIAGAPLMALGTIATNSKKQTALIALQTWNNAPID